MAPRADRQPRRATDPEDEALLADSVGLALLVVLETLTPAERLAFVLHDMFGVPFEEIAPIVDRSPAAARQLASRARRRVRGAAPTRMSIWPGSESSLTRSSPRPGPATSRRCVAVLDPDVIFRADTGPGSRLARPPVEGAEPVARRVLERGRPLAGLARPALVNGAAGLVVGRPDRPLAVVGFTIAGGHIVAIDLITDPEKLARVAPR